MTIYSLDVLLFLFGTSLLFQVQFSLLLPDLHTMDYTEAKTLNKIQQILNIHSSYAETRRQCLLGRFQLKVHVR